MLSVHHNPDLTPSPRSTPTRPSPLRNEDKTKSSLRNHKVHPNHKLLTAPTNYNRKNHQKSPSTEQREDNLPINHLFRNGGNASYDIEHLLSSSITDGPYGTQPTLSKYLSKSQTNWTQPFFNSVSASPAPTPTPAPAPTPNSNAPITDDKFVHNVSDVVVEEPTAELYKIRINQRQNAIHHRQPQFTRKFPRKFTLMELDIRFKLVQRYMKGERVANYGFLNRLTNVKLVVNPLTMEPVRLDPVYSKGGNPNQPLLSFMTLKKKQMNSIAPVPASSANSPSSQSVFQTKQKRGYRSRKPSNESTESESQSDSANSTDNDECSEDSQSSEALKPVLANRPKLIKNHSRISPSTLSNKPGTLDNPNPIKLSLPPLPHNPQATPKMDDKSNSLVPVSKPKKEKPAKSNTVNVVSKNNNKETAGKRSATADNSYQSNEADDLLKDWFGSSSFFGSDNSQSSGTKSTTSQKTGKNDISNSKVATTPPPIQASSQQDESYFSCPSTTLDFSDVSHLNHLFSSPSLTTPTTSYSDSPPSTPSSTDSIFPFSASSHDLISANASSMVSDSTLSEQSRPQTPQSDLTACPSSQLNFDDPSSVNLFMSSLWDTPPPADAVNSPATHTKQKSSGKIDSKLIYDTLKNYSPTKPQPNFFHVNPHRNFFAIWQKTTPIIIGQLSKLGRNRQWQQREFRFDGLNLICLSPDVIPITAGDLVNLEDPDYVNENWRSYFQPGQPPTPHLNHPLVATPLPKSSLVQHYQKPKWIIRIDEILDVSLLTRKGVRHPDCFVLNTTNRRYVLKCPNEKDLASWVYILQLMIRSYAKLSGANLNGNISKTLGKKFGEEEAEGLKFGTFKSVKDKSKFFSLKNSSNSGLAHTPVSNYTGALQDPLNGDCKPIVQDWLRGIDHLIDSEYDCKVEGWLQNFA